MSRLTRVLVLFAALVFGGHAYAQTQIGGTAIATAVPGFHAPVGWTGWKKWSVARARVKAGVVTLANPANATLLLLGDSTTLGTGAGAFNAGAGNYATSYAGRGYPVQLCGQLVRQGIVPSCSNQSVFGDLGYGAPQNGDPRIQPGVGWTFATQQSIGGFAWKCPAAVSTTTTVTFTQAYDTVTVYYIQTAGLGTVSGNLDGGTAVTASAAGSNAVSHITITASLATHVLNLTRSAGSDIYILGAVASNSATRDTWVISGGQSGKKMLDLVGQSSGSPANLAWSGGSGGNAAVSPDMTVINAYINDAVAGTTVSTYQGYLHTLIVQAQTTGDVMVVIGMPIALPTDGQGSFLAQATQDIYTQALIDQARADNVPYLDLREVSGTWAQNSALGLMNDGYHPNAMGYAMIPAQSIAQALAQ